ncbi:MAG TPA: DNA-binding protein [Firmicutes bacterium]|nr:DNA-binding protein [Bacillota bacterium]
MRIKREKDILFAVFEEGEKISESMMKLINDPRMEETGVILTALGMIKNVEIGYGLYDGSKVDYENSIFTGPFELLGFSGFILKGEEKPYHIHVYLGDRDKKAIGGHLIDGEVHTFIEMAILVSNAKIKREISDGLPLLDL